MSDNGKILGALLLGAAAGAVLGLLFAPSKGSDLRKKIKDNAEDLLDELNDKIKEGKDTLADMKEKVTSRAEEMKAKAEEEMEGYRRRVKHNGSAATEM